MSDKGLLHCYRVYPITPCGECPHCLANAEVERLRAEVERLTTDPTIYKHQCGHCSRLSPLPFLIPGYLIQQQENPQ